MKSLNEDIERWISLGKLKKEYEKVIYRKEILALTRSELGKRMKEAAQKKLLYKERQFVTGIPFSDMNKDAKRMILLLFRELLMYILRKKIKLFW